MGISSSWRSLGQAVERRESLVLASTLAIVVGLWAFVLIAGLVSYGSTQAIDEAMLRWFRQVDDPQALIGGPWLEHATRDLTALGSATVLNLLILVVAGYLALERRWSMVAMVLIASYGGMTLSSTLKALFMRARPHAVPHLVDVSSPSFPSGHSMQSAVVYLTLGALFATFVRERSRRIYFLAVAMLLTFLVGLSRVIAGVHYPTDVLGGWAAGLAWALVCVLVERQLERKRVLRSKL
ncbi:MAG: hypothetical protein QOD06_128 [Candidatus Binatota bacterium]|jgi:undecaprenyl-diphosphatase|nr:hypothetical protein [Candidatus Binatota bacterium]